MGYRTVQISAVGRNIPAKTIKKLCDDCGLSIVLTHTDVERMLGDIDGVIEDHEIMDCPYIGIGAMPERYRNKALDLIKKELKDYLPLLSLLLQIQN